MLEKLRRIARSDKSTTSTLEVVGEDQHIVYPDDEAAADHLVVTNEEFNAPIDTNDPAAWYHQGNLYRDANKMEAALSCYYHTAEMQPKCQDARSGEIEGVVKTGLVVFGPTGCEERIADFRAIRGKFVMSETGNKNQRALQSRFHYELTAKDRQRLIDLHRHDAVPRTHPIAPQHACVRPRTVVEAGILPAAC